MRALIVKYRKRIAAALAAIVLPPMLVVLLLWWDCRPKPQADVSIAYVTTFRQGTSNMLLFVVTNRSDFPVSYAVWREVPTGAGSDGWSAGFPPGTAPRIGPISATGPNSTGTVVVAAWTTNQWRVMISGGDSHVSGLDNVRRWIAFRMRRLGWWALADRVTGRKADFRAHGPAMLGDSPAPSVQ